ncbi:MAG: hypothetical protein ACOC5M_03980 [Chloroflexota bacterium]
MATSSLISEGHDERPSYQQITENLASGTRGASSNFKLFAIALAILGVLGVIGAVSRLAMDSGDRGAWGYYAATVAWMLTVFGGAPMAAIAPVWLAKSDWARPVARIAMLGSLGLFVTGLLLLPLVFQLPPLVEDGIRRRTIWFEAPNYSPHVWNILGIFLLAVTGLAMSYVASLPDLAMVRDHGSGWKQRWARRLARGFRGTTTQWSWLRMRVGVLAAFYFALLVFEHFLYNMDFMQSLVPGMKDAILPLYHAMTSIQAGVAFVILGVWAARKWGGMKGYLHQDQMWSLGKLLLATSLLWFYFFWSGFIIYWYGRSHADIDILDLLVSEPYVYLFWTTAVLMFVAPWWILVWNKVRDSLWGPPIAATLVVFGALVDRIRLHVPAWTVESGEEIFTSTAIRGMPQTVWPDLFDLFVMIGAPALGLLLIVMAARLVPAVSVWEMHQSRLLSKPVRYMRGHGLLVGKPD